MEKLQVGPCPKCGGHSQFYHVVGDVNMGYCVCEKCGRKQAKVQEREVAVAKWNGLVTTGPKRIWDNFKEIAEVQKSDAIKFVIAAATRKGYRYLNIREFYKRKKDDVWMPGRDGITIPLRAPITNGEKILEPFKEVIQGLMDAADFAQTMELMNEEKAVWMEPKQIKE